MKKFVKMNNNNNHLSFGNLCRIIKETAVSKTFTNQADIFNAIFDCDEINDSTVNNYCIGYRSIGTEFKNTYFNYRKKYEKNKFTLIDNTLNIISILDGYIYINENNDKTLKLINENENFKKLCNSLYNLSKNDKTVALSFSERIKSYIDSNQQYEAFCEILFYIILEKKQPLYIDKIVNEAIENLLKNTNISINDLEKILRLQLMGGINYTHSLRKLAQENNPYATFTLGEMEYKGEIAGYPRYNKAFEYFDVSAKTGHPSANWAIAQMILKKEIGTASKQDLHLAWDYLQKAKDLGSIAAINTIGIFYKLGYVPNEEKNEKKAITYFEKAAQHNYAYAYNNLGMIYEKRKQFDEAFEYYLKSANLEESWACNKIGEFYRQGIGTKKDIHKAFEYYNLSCNVPIRIMCHFSKYNLAKYFYMNGNYEVKIEKDEKKAIELLEEASNYNIIEATKELIYIYAEKYVKTRNQKYKDLMNNYIEKLETSNQYNENLKKEIEEKFKKIKQINTSILDK